MEIPQKKILLKFLKAVILSNKLRVFAIAIIFPLIFANFSYEKNDFYLGEEFSYLSSYYGPRFHGKTTANGEEMDKNEYTCAHRTLPFGTMLEVDNMQGKSVILRVNDRGPYIKGRDLDVSFQAAKDLNMIQKGVMQLKVKIIGFDHEITLHKIDE